MSTRLHCNTSLTRPQQNKNSNAALMSCQEVWYVKKKLKGGGSGFFRFNIFRSPEIEFSRYQIHFPTPPPTLQVLQTLEVSFQSETEVFES